MFFNMMVSTVFIFLSMGACLAKRSCPDACVAEKANNAPINNVLTSLFKILFF